MSEREQKELAAEMADAAARMARALRAMDEDDPFATFVVTTADPPPYRFDSFRQCGPDISLDGCDVD